MMFAAVRQWMAEDDRKQREQEPSDKGEFEESDEFGFVDEGTNEYDVPTAFTSSSARTEVGLDAPEAIEDTRELEVPRSLKPRRRQREIPAEVRDQWESRGRVAGRFRRWFYSDPVVVWFYHLPKRTRRTLSWALWIIVAAATIITVFLSSTIGIYPLVAEYLRPSLAPKPESPLRTLPRQGRPFDLVEDRELSAKEFRLATDCIWLTADPGTGYTIDEGGLSLELDGKTVAELDIRYNWDGLVRLYFGAGRVPPREDLMLRVPIHRGGLWSLERGRGYELFRQGGREPSSVLIGPIRFSD
jgi:hypothetical protein